MLKNDKFCYVYFTVNLKNLMEVIIAELGGINKRKYIKGLA